MWVVPKYYTLCETYVQYLLLVQCALNDSFYLLCVSLYNSTRNQALSSMTTLDKRNTSAVNKEHNRRVHIILFSYAVLFTAIALVTLLSVLLSWRNRIQIVDCGFKDASMPTLLSLSDTCLYIICLFKCFVRLSGFSSCSRGSRWRLTAVTSHPLHCACLWLCFQFNKMWHLFLALCSMKLCKDTVDWEGGCVYQCDWCATVCARQTAQLLEFISFSRNWKCSTNHLNLTKTT